MNDNNNSPNPFSLIADFDGDISELYNREFNDVLPVLPLRNMTFFPGVVAPVIVGRESSMALVKQAVDNGSLIALACQRESEKEAPKIEDLYPIGVVAKIMRVLELPNGATSVILQSYGRISLGAATRQRPFLRARVKKLEDVLPEVNDKEYQVMVDSCKELTIRLLRTSDIGHEEAVFAIQNISHPIFLINFICTNLPFPMQEKQELIAEPDQKKTTLRLMGILNRECQYASLKLHIQNQTREELDQQQKEYFLQQQIKNIQSELGDAQNSDVKELREKAKDLNFPPKVEETFNKELQKLERLNPQNPDYSVELNYLQTLTNLPWGKQTEDKISIPNAERILNREHYGLEKVKERILEHLALMQYKEGLKTPILCLYGPPGVGKTSLGKSIANALGRKYVRVSLGGVHDEAEVRGHRRTYVGSMPGRIIKGLIKAQTDNPVFVLDEIDKVSDNNYNGDPQSALLEVLDPEQNSAFHDNFLDVDYDLSKVLFVATANSLSTLPRPLLDRMEIISVDGYLTEEKREIARRHLIPRIEEGLGLLGNIKFAPAALEFIIEKYTRESGVRQLEKQLEKIYRKIAFHKAKNGT
ncbi:MAG: endopeptidase La, partial [Alloprevotella tannerae]|nr:endopeptidase La [Alloprevotella tannerae]